jgi:signal transduction histidine kinase
MCGLADPDFGRAVGHAVNHPGGEGVRGVMSDRPPAVSTGRAEVDDLSAACTGRIGLAVFDRQRRLVFANPGFRTLVGSSSNRLEPGQDFDAILALMETQQTFTGEQGVDFTAPERGTAFSSAWTMRWRPADGRFIDVVFESLPDGGGAIVVNDIAAPVLDLDDVRRRADLLDQVLLRIPHGICVYGPDDRVAMFNDAYTEVMVGAPVRVGDFRDDVIRRRAEAGEYGTGLPDVFVATETGYEVVHPQVRLRVRPNGTAIEIRTTPFPDGGYISVVTDVSALLQAGTESRRWAAEMAMMLENIHHGILLWGADGRLIASNAVVVSLLGLPQGFLTPGRPVTELIATLAGLGHFGPEGEAAPMARRVLACDRSEPIGREVTTHTGRILFAQSNPTPGGGWVTTLSDITQMRETKTELRLAKERAEAANEAKSRFLSTMSHELRTPLNVIIGFSGALEAGHGEGRADLVTEFSGEINAAGKQLLSLINIILDVARIESGQFEPGSEAFNLPNAIRAAVRQTAGAARDGEITVDVLVDDDLPRVRGDERQITLALSQLLSNAVKFTQVGGTVTMRAGSTDESDFDVTITDTGIGIQEADLERIFEPFTQLDTSLSRRYPGAGLGLFTARAIVVAHGGQLVLSSRPGAGTTARITLPRVRGVEGAKL